LVSGSHAREHLGCGDVISHPPVRQLRQS